MGLQLFPRKQEAAPRLSASPLVALAGRLALASQLFAAVARGLSFTSFARSPQARATDLGGAQRTLATLDRNGDGAVDRQEVVDFAQLKGMDVESVTQDFLAIDINGDGRLDVQEIGGALESRPTSPLQMPPPAPLKASPPVVAAASPRQLATAHRPLQLLSDELEQRRRQEDGTLAGQFVEGEEREAKALTLQQQATELRVNATAFAKSAAQEAAEVGHRTAREAALAVIKRVDELEAEAEKADGTAAALRAKTKLELLVADRLLAAAAAAASGVK